MYALDRSFIAPLKRVLVEYPASMAKMSANKDDRKWSKLKASISFSHSVAHYVFFLVVWDFSIYLLTSSLFL